MSEQPQTRYHGKVRVQKGETLIEVNIFDDNKEKLYLEVQQADLPPVIVPLSMLQLPRRPRVV
jgi:hypothetical protein